MELDARNLEQIEIFKWLREAMSSCRINDECIDILVGENISIKRMKSFAAMSGYQITAEEKEGYNVLHLTGGSCGCAG